MLFVCPKCMKKLIASERGVASCENGHSYDRSREGYYNLLLGSVGGTHGDNKEMIEARRAFLSLGHYRPLAEAIADLAIKYMPRGGVLLDAGLGEGYYTEIIAEKLNGEADLDSPLIVGFDISKDAVKRASRRRGISELAVAGSYHMPISDSSCDILVNTFSPLAVEETRRVLRNGGKFIFAFPAEEHLFGLKEKIYDLPYKNSPRDTALAGFSLVEDRELKYEIHLSLAEDIKALFMMTPYAYRTDALGRERVLSLKELKTEVHFKILVYEKL